MNKNRSTVHFLFCLCISSLSACAVTEPTSEPVRHYVVSSQDALRLAGEYKLFNGQLMRMEQRSGDWYLNLDGELRGRMRPIRRGMFVSADDASVRVEFGLGDTALADVKLTIAPEECASIAATLSSWCRDASAAVAVSP